MSKNLQLIVLGLLISFSGFAQVGIGTTSPDASSALDITATDKGFLMNASGDCEGLGRYSKTYGHYLWVQGPATAFYSILLKRRTIEKP